MWHITPWIFSFTVTLMIPPRLCQYAKNLEEREIKGLPLIFPPTAPTRTQFICGIGIPLEGLLIEALTTGYVLKAEYFLPDSVEKLYSQQSTNIAGRNLQNGNTTDYEYTKGFSERMNDNIKSFSKMLKDKYVSLSKYRWSIYKGLEALGNRMGLVGRSCVLKSICEAAEVPFDHRNGIIAELLHILLTYEITPSSSADELSVHSDNEYFYAESLGRSGGKCSQVFRDCDKSLLNGFTQVYTLPNDLMSLLP